MIGLTNTKCQNKPEVCVSTASRLWCHIFIGKPSRRHNCGWSSLTLSASHLHNMIADDALKNKKKVNFVDIWCDIIDRKTIFVRCKIPLPNMLKSYSHMLDCVLVGRYYKLSAQSAPPIVVSADESDDMIILDGKHRLEAAHRRGDTIIEVFKPTWMPLNKIRF